MIEARWRLGELFEAAGLPGPGGKDSQVVTGVTDDSRKAGPGCVFVATRGTRTDSHLFISDAVDRGASVIVSEDEIPDYPSTRLVRVDDSRDALGRLAHAAAGNPSRGMLVVAVTGTNGKTTSTYMLESILRCAGYEPAVVGTIEYRYRGRSIEASNTTPSSIQLAKLFAEMRDAGVNAVVFEASSHAADQRRVAGIELDGAILTNITQDHLDYHLTMESYAEAKRSVFFDYLLRPRTGKGKRGPVAAFNVDDPWGARFASEFKGSSITFGLGDEAAVKGSDIRIDATGTSFLATSPFGPLKVSLQLVGMFNVMNALGVIACGAGLGLPGEVIEKGLATLPCVPGRFETVVAGQDFLVVVDYAHTPDALERVLANARLLTRGQLICVFGCGGDRDRKKRPIMGRIAGASSDRVIVTSDNPRTEDPLSIIEMIREGVEQSGISPDRVSWLPGRREAIEAALAAAEPGDVVVVAGKGHEDYQILGTEKIHFDDREVARQYLLAHGGQRGDR